MNPTAKLFVVFAILFSVSLASSVTTRRFPVQIVKDLKAKVEESFLGFVQDTWNDATKGVNTAINAVANGGQQGWDAVYQTGEKAVDWTKNTAMNGFGETKSTGEQAIRKIVAATNYGVNQMKDLGFVFNVQMMSMLQKVGSTLDPRRLSRDDIAVVLKGIQTVTKPIGEVMANKNVDFFISNSLFAPEYLTLKAIVSILNNPDNAQEELLGLHPFGKIVGHIIIKTIQNPHDFQNHLLEAIPEAAVLLADLAQMLEAAQYAQQQSMGRFLRAENPEKQELEPIKSVIGRGVRNSFHEPQPAKAVIGRGVRNIFKNEAKKPQE